VLFPTHDEVALMREGDINENVIQKNVDQEMSQNDDIIVKPIGNSDLQVVRICKTVEALGATIKNDGDSVIISRIINGGLVDKTGQLHEGDEIIKCNGINLTGKHVDEVSNTIAESSMTGDIELVIRPTNRPAVPKNEKLTEELHVRSLFTYDPFDDVHVPCKELALKFDKGDILHITDRSDPNWWQAFRDGETGITLAGLIPSSQFEEKRQALLKSFQNKDEEERTHGKFCKRIKRNKKNKNTKQKPIPETFRTYEKMALYQQPEGKKRPIILIGASNVGRQEVRQRLLDEEKHRFQAAVPHTTRPMREGEVNGRDYYFVPKDIFVNDINEFKFIEHGIFEKHYYGTSLDSMRHIVDSGKICVIQLHAPSLLALYKTDLMPYVIFISAPNVETLREIFVSRMQKDLSDQELKETVEASMEIEKEYACYFDKVIRLTDLDRTYDELFSTINKLGQTPQWVPEIWLKRKNGY
jgi:MAGUK p55 subfamily protein 5